MDLPVLSTVATGMIPIKISLALVVALSACSAPAREPDGGAVAATGAPGAGKSPARPPSGTHAFSGAGGLVRLTYADPLKPSRDFVGGALITAGWRLMWDGGVPGPGTPVVSVAEDARPTADIGYVTEFVQVGMSRDPGVVATCGTAGVGRGTANRQPNRILGGHRWTVWTAGDAGMNQGISATNYRTVVDGVCYAIDRATYSVKAADPKPGMPTQKAAAARIDAVLASIRVGGR